MIRSLSLIKAQSRSKSYSGRRTKLGLYASKLYASMHDESGSSAHRKVFLFHHICLLTPNISKLMTQVSLPNSRDVYESHFFCSKNAILTNKSLHHF